MYRERPALFLIILTEPCCPLSVLSIIALATTDACETPPTSQQRPARDARKFLLNRVDDDDDYKDDYYSDGTHAALLAQPPVGDVFSARRRRRDDCGTCQGALFESNALGCI